MVTSNSDLDQFTIAKDTCTFILELNEGKVTLPLFSSRMKVKTHIVLALCMLVGVGF